MALQSPLTLGDIAHWVEQALEATRQGGLMAVPERVVISGAGCCTALGHDLDSVARSLREGRDAFRASGALEGLSVCPAEDWGRTGPGSSSKAGGIAIT